MQDFKLHIQFRPPYLEMLGTTKMLRLNLKREQLKT